MNYLGIAAFVIAMAVTWAVTPLVILAARRLGATDAPGERKIHREPMPRIGGVAVFAGFVAGMLFAAIATQSLFVKASAGVYWRGLAFAAFGLLVVGLVDDIRGLSFRWKFAAQIVAAVAVWHWGFSVEVVSHPFGGTLDLGLLSLPVTLLWIVGITNAVNLIDGLDGLAAGIALITTSALAAIAYTGGRLGMTAVCVTLAGALIGFLRFNFNPARIFLGDSGSLFLGFVLAVVSVRSSQKGPTAVAILVPLLVLGLPLFDTGMAVVRRLYRLGTEGAKTGRMLRHIASNMSEVFLPDRGHIHHQLLDVGLSHRTAVLTLYLVGVAFAAAAFLLVVLKSLWMAAVLVGSLAVALAGFYGVLYLRLRREAPQGRGRDGCPTPEAVGTGVEPLAPGQRAHGR